MKENPERFFDLVIVGAGAAGMLCALESARRGRRVLLLDHASRPGAKIRVSGGGKCNFTHLDAAPRHYLSQTPNFCRSALKAFPPQRFLDLMRRHGLSWHEKAPGQLFGDAPAESIVALLVEECRQAGVRFLLGVKVGEVERLEGGEARFAVETSGGRFTARSLIAASGGLSFPKLGATDWGWRLARRFGLSMVPPRPALVPLLLGGELRSWTSGLAGASLPVTAGCGGARFTDDLLFTHRGLSGPAILQISSHWRSGEPLTLDLAPGVDLAETLIRAKREAPRQQLITVMGRHWPRRLAQAWLGEEGERRMGDMTDARLREWARGMKAWEITPEGTEGYRVAEVTAGGVEGRGLNPKTMEAMSVPGLYFVGELVDVTGELGGYNLQWAWSSGAAAGACA